MERICIVQLIAARAFCQRQRRVCVWKQKKHKNFPSKGVWAQTRCKWTPLSLLLYCAATPLFHSPPFIWHCTSFLHLQIGREHKVRCNMRLFLYSIQKKKKEKGNGLFRSSDCAYRLLPAHLANKTESNLTYNSLICDRQFPEDVQRYKLQISQNNCMI